MRGLSFLLPPVLLLLACGGGSTSVRNASSLGYTSPTDTSSWRLVQAASSTSTHLVLDLLAPAGASGQGVTLVLTTTPSLATWSFATGASYAAVTAYPTPVVNVASVQGANLRILVAKAPGTPVAYGTGPVLTVALDLASGAPPGAVAVTVAQAGHLGTKAPPAPITVAVGSLQAK